MTNEYVDKSADLHPPIAIMYICIGEYYKFFDEFYKSCEVKFCQGTRKNYFVFSENPDLIPKFDNIVHIYQDDIGWPLNTLFRFKMFARASNYIDPNSFVVFFNSNCFFQRKVDFNEFFGDSPDIIGCLHPGYFDKDLEGLPFERRSYSKAFVNSGKDYFAGGLIGGRAKVFFRACKILDERIDADFSSGYMAVWHDESHWNCLLDEWARGGDCKITRLNPGYLYPEGYNLPFEKKILLRKKSNFINLHKAKGGRRPFFLSRFKLWLQSLCLNLIKFFR